MGERIFINRYIHAPKGVYTYTLLQYTWTFSKIENMVGYKTLHKVKVIEVVSTLFLDYGVLKIEMK